MYCRNCGVELSSEVKFCFNCGTATNGDEIPGRIQYGNNNYMQRNVDDLLLKFSERVRIEAIIWLVIACIQILGGIYLNWVVFIVGIFNLVVSISDFQYSSAVIQNPVGIVNRVKPLTRAIIVLIYNLLIGAMIGVIGSVYYLVAVRGLVMENQNHFWEIEQAYRGKFY